MIILFIFYHCVLLCCQNISIPEKRRKYASEMESYQDPKNLNLNTWKELFCILALLKNLLMAPHFFYLASFTLSHCQRCAKIFLRSQKICMENLQISICPLKDWKTQEFSSGTYMDGNKIFSFYVFSSSFSYFVSIEITRFYFYLFISKLNWVQIHLLLWTFLA